MRYQFKDFLLVGPFTNFLKVKREKGKNKTKVGGGKRERQKEREGREERKGKVIRQLTAVAQLNVSLKVTRLMVSQH